MLSSKTFCGPCPKRLLERSVEENSSGQPGGSNGNCAEDTPKGVVADEDGIAECKPEKKKLAHNTDNNFRQGLSNHQLSSPYGGGGWTRGVDGFLKSVEGSDISDPPFGSCGLSVVFGGTDAIIVVVEVVGEPGRRGAVVLRMMLVTVPPPGVKVTTAVEGPGEVSGTVCWIELLEVGEAGYVTLSEG